MKGLLLEQGIGSTAAGRPLQRISFSGDEGGDEKWLQRLLFEHPYLIPLGVIDPGAEEFVVICREFSIPKEGSTVYLDILAVTPHGRLVLIECKLWRNPQARREVIAQILEYASLLRRWTYADLTVRLRSTLKASSSNPLFDLVRARHPQLQEAVFVDAVSRCLAAGDFNLVVAGDGIRSDLQAIAAHLNSYSGLTARLALLEIQRWRDDEGRTVIVPFVPYRTEVLQHRVIVDAGGIPLVLVSPFEEADVAAPAVDKDQTSQLAQNRAFWQRFIDSARFDHADQSPPRHGGNNWVKINLPDPIRWLTAYRNRTEVGLFFRLSDDTGSNLFKQLAQDAADLNSEVGRTMTFVINSEVPFKGTISVVEPLGLGARPDDDAYLAWLRETANSLVSAIRLRLAAFRDASTSAPDF